MASFESKVKIDHGTGCWLWDGGIRKDGYVAFDAGRRVCGSVLAHRFSYFVTFGPVADGLVLDHICRIRHCVNPHHLRAVTQSENILAGLSDAAQNARKEGCQKCGRPYKLIMGSRRCTECTKLYHREYARRRTEKRRMAKQMAEQNGQAALMPKISAALAQINQETL